MECLIGVRNAIIPSLALWALIILGVMALAGCARPQPMGENIWKALEQRR